MKRVLLVTVLLLVLYPATALSRLSLDDIYEVGMMESDYITTEKFVVPQFNLYVVDPWQSAGWTLIAPTPSRYTVVLKWYYTSDQAKKIMAHEIGHILMDHYQVPQTEQMANDFAGCFGSPEARDYAKRFHEANDTPARCAEIKQLFKGGE